MEAGFRSAASIDHDRSGGSNPRRRIIIAGAAGRDFHNFNMLYRDDPDFEVVAFTAAQIPGIAGRQYPAVLAGSLYLDGIPIAYESELDQLCRAHSIHEVVFAYSDVPHEHVMHVASRSLAAGASFVLCGPNETMIKSSLPVIAVTAVRTGCGKSVVARWLSRRLRERHLRVAVLRHPMPYGDLARERVQRLASIADLDAAECTAEEREEYEPHIALGNVVFAGVDYGQIVAAAEREADIIVWDGGNNDFPFLRPDLHVVLADALRPRQITTHHPGETVARMADVLIINKVDAARAADVRMAEHELRAINPAAPIVRSASPVAIENGAAVTGRRVLVIEDGPTITHGGMAHGAGFLAATTAGAVVVDPRDSADPILQEIFEAYPHIGKVLPAVGYGPTQLAALERTINNAAVDVIVSATPLDLSRLIRVNKPIVRVRYEFAETDEPKLSTIVDAFIDGLKRGTRKS